MEVDFVWRGLCVRREPAPGPQRRGGGPQFLAHVYCGQMAAWIKMPLGTEVGLRPDGIVLDGDPAPLPKKVAEPSSPIFGPFRVWFAAEICRNTCLEW